MARFGRLKRISICIWWLLFASKSASMWSLYLAIPALLLLVSFVRNHFFHPLSKFPGPFWAAQTDIWRVYHLWTRYMPNTLLELHEKYGPVVRIGPNDLSFQHAAAIDAIYKSGRKLIKSNFYDGFTTFHPNLFGTRDEELHAKRRRQMAHSFSLASLSQMELIFDRHIRNLLSAIASHGSEPFDLKELIAYYAYDVMGELIFNADFGTQKSQDTNGLPPINEHIFLGCMYGMLPSLLPYSMRFSGYIPLPWLQNLLESRKVLRDRTAQHVVQEMARDKTSEHHSILTRLIRAKDPETGESLTQDQVSSEAFGFLVAGSHTTSGTLTLLFYHLLQNAEASGKLTKELVAGLPWNNPEAESIPAYSGLEAQLPYATACIRENFRISPVFTMPLPRTVCDPNGAVINGIHVPQGANVSTMNHVLHHCATVWGNDHNLYRPERWLDPTRPLSPNDLLPFGTGHRACIGRNIAMMSIVKVLTTVWRQYELKPLDLDAPLDVQSVGISEKKGPLMVKAALRGR